MLSLGITPSLLQFIALGAVYAPQIGKEQNPAVCGGHEEVLHNIVAAQLSTSNTLTAAMLAAVLVAAGTFDVSAAGNRYDNFFLRNKVFHRHIAVETAQNLGTAVITVTIHDLAQFLGNNLALAIFRGNNRIVFRNEALQLVVAILNLLTFQSRQTTKLHIQNCLSLRFINIQEVHQSRTSFISCGGAADKCNNLIQSIQSLEQTTQNMCFFLSLTQTVPSTTYNHVHLVVYPVANEGIKRESARNAIYNRQHIGREVLLQLCVLIQVVEYNLGHGIAFEHNHEALTGTA